MTRDEARKYLPLITAFANGELIEVYQPSTGTWTTLEEPGFFIDSIYRIRPDDYLCQKCGKHSCVCNTDKTENNLPPMYKMVVVLTKEGWCKAARCWRGPNHWIWARHYVGDSHMIETGKYDLSVGLDVIEWQPI